MTKYNVVAVSVFRDPCTHGRHHIREVLMSPSLGVLVNVSPYKLLSMREDTIVATNPDNVDEQVPVAFVPCECLIGYVVVPAGVVEEIAGNI
jgi:hypothetical protein